MKTMKKMLTLVLAMVLVLALALPAMAATTYTITIEGSKSNHVAGSSDGHTYEAYQVLAGTMDSEGLNLGSPEWGANLATNASAFLTELKADATFGEGPANLFSSVETAEQFAAEIAKSTFTTVQLERVASIMNKHLTGTPVDTSTELAAPYTLEVEAGYYLIKDQDGSLSGDKDKDYTDIILHVSESTTIYHKGSIPTVDKTVSEANSSYHEAIEVALHREYFYKVVATLPSDFDDYSKYELNFIDTASAGIDFVDANPDVDGFQLVSAIAVYDEQEGDDKEETLLPYDAVTNDHGYKVEVSGKTMKVLFEDLKHGGKHPFQAGDKVIIVYKAKLNESAVVGADGNSNEVYLEYTNNAETNGKGETNPDDSEVYTYGLKLTKIAGKDTTDVLEGVTFKLYREVKQGDGQPSIFKYAVVNANGVITAWIDSKDAATLLETNEDGEIVIKGLDTNVTYSLEEIDPLPGYNKIGEPISVYLTATKDDAGVVTTVWMNENTHVNTITNYEEGSNVVGVQFYVPNYKGDVLPSTGGIGTTIFYVLGSVMFLGAALLLITKKRVA